MRIRRRTDHDDEKIQLQMTPMIDIVFQLLVFFIMTFKIVVLEGDFNIKMPANSAMAGDPEDIVPPLNVKLEATAAGNLSNITLNGRSLGPDFTKLHQEIVEFLGEERGPGSIQETAEVEFDCAFNLRYKETVAAITAVSGYKEPDGNIIKLVEKIKFTPPAENAGGG
jgi:biopolymer transport protein ExbD